MAGKKDAAWWRAYREDKRRKQQQSQGLRPPVVAEGSLGAIAAVQDVRGPVPEFHLPTATPQQPVAKQVAAERWAEGLHDLTPIATGFPDGTVEFAAKPKPALIDCAACGHDRAYYHTAACTHPYVAGGPQSGIVGSPCGCPHFIDPESPF